MSVDTAIGTENKRRKVCEIKVNNRTEQSVISFIVIDELPSHSKMYDVSNRNDLICKTVP